MNKQKIKEKIFSKLIMSFIVFAVFGYISISSFVKALTLKSSYFLFTGILSIVASFLGIKRFLYLNKMRKKFKWETRSNIFA